MIKAQHWRRGWLPQTLLWYNLCTNLAPKWSTWIDDFHADIFACNWDNRQEMTTYFARFPTMHGDDGDLDTAMDKLTVESILSHKTSFWSTTVFQKKSLIS